jgi:hypothetical protein
VLVHLITEPELSAAVPLGVTLAADLDEERLGAALAYEAAPDSAHRCSVPPGAGRPPAPRCRSPNPTTVIRRSARPVVDPAGPRV